MTKHLSFWTALALAWLTGLPLRAQDLLRDQPSLSRIEQGLNHMYGYEFGEARQQFQEVQAKYPQHPATPLIDALMILWQHQPFADFKSAAFAQHRQLLEKTISLAEARLAKNEDDVEGVYFKMVACGLLVLHYNDMGESMKAVGETKRLYTLIKQSFDLRSQNPELYLMTGLYNYYREYYPQAHPVYKPVAMFFKSGSRREGLADLEFCARKGIFSAPEAEGYLAFINLRYEKNPPKALLHSRHLVSKYPKNLHYVANLAETLLLTRNYAEALPFAQQLEASPRPFRQAVGKVFGAMVAEFHQKDLDAAGKAYHQAEALFKKEGNYADPYRVYVYAGLHRHYQRLGNKVQANHYRQLAKHFDTYNYLAETF